MNNEFQKKLAAFSPEAPKVIYFDPVLKETRTVRVLEDWEWVRKPLGQSPEARAVARELPRVGEEREDGWNLYNYNVQSSYTPGLGNSLTFHHKALPYEKHLVVNEAEWHQIRKIEERILREYHPELFGNGS